MTNKEKQIKTLISGIISNDDTKINDAIHCLSESIVIEKQGAILNAIIDSLKGVHNV